jgi:hypothetical protein
MDKAKKIIQHLVFSNEESILVAGAWLSSGVSSGGMLVW